MAIFKRNIDEKATETRANDSHYADFISPYWVTSYSDAMKISAVQRCVNLISNSIAMLPLNLYRRTAGGSKARVVSEMSEIVATSPNQIQTHFDLFKCIGYDLLLRGNAYVKIIREGTKVKALKRIPPGEVTALVDTLNMEIKYSTAKDGIVESDSMIHLKNNSKDGILGISQLDYARKALELAADEQDSANKFFSKGGNITGLLKYKTIINDKQRNEIKTSWNSLMSDGGIAVLGGDADYQTITLSPEQLSLISSRTFSLGEIARFFDLDSVLIGDTSQSSYNTQEACMQSFLTNCLQPRLTAIEQELTKKMLVPSEKAQGYFFSFDTSDLLRATKLDMANYWSLLLNAGIVTINEIREKLDLPKVADGDENYIQLNMTTIKKIKQNPDNEGNTQP